MMLLLGGLHRMMKKEVDEGGAVLLFVPFFFFLFLFFFPFPLSIPHYHHCDISLTHAHKTTCAPDHQTSTASPATPRTSAPTARACAVPPVRVCGHGGAGLEYCGAVGRRLGGGAGWAGAGGGVSDCCVCALGRNCRVMLTTRMPSWTCAKHIRRSCRRWPTNEPTDQRTNEPTSQPFDRWLGSCGLVKPESYQAHWFSVQRASSRLQQYPDTRLDTTASSLDAIGPALPISLDANFRVVASSARSSSVGLDRAAKGAWLACSAKPYLRTGEYLLLDG